MANGSAPQASPADNPVFRALRDYQAGARGALPRFAAEAPPEPRLACSPACQWGVCVRVRGAAGLSVAFAAG